jgi:transcription termination factor Rho
LTDSTDTLTQPDPSGTTAAAASSGSSRPRTGGLTSLKLADLQAMASGMGISGTGRMRKSQLIDAIKQSAGGSSEAPAEQPRARKAAAPTPAREPAPSEVSSQVSSEVSSQASSAAPEQAGGRAAARAETAERGDRSSDATTAGSQSRNENRVDTRGDSRPDEQGEDRPQSRDGNRDNGRDGDRDSRGGGGDDDYNRSGGRRRRRSRDRSRDRNDNRGDNRGDNRSDRDRNDRPVTEDDVLLPVAGILDLLDNYAFVRTSGYLPGANDVYVSMAMVRRNNLRKGDAITGVVRQPREGDKQQKFNALVRVDTVNGADPQLAGNRPDFARLVPLYPQDRLRLESEPHLTTPRVIDLVAPIGKGQRGLIVSPPKAGKTMVLQAIANAITTNNPECHLMVVLVDERPEEVTDMQRTVKGEVIASTFDRPADDHTTVAELAIERARRLVELGHDVVVLLDSITRLGRAYNLAAPASGRILSGGVDSSALYPPKRFFGAARNIEDGGSLTILATALVETGSKMDEVIFEEFKGTGNMELKLSRQLADKRIFPAVDVDASGTRKEEILLAPDELKVVWKLRRVLSGLDDQQAIELLLTKLRETSSNYEFLMQVQKTTPTAPGGLEERG